MSDKSLSFFVNTYNEAIRNKPKDPITGAISRDIDVDYQINTYDTKDSFKTVKSENKNAKYTVTQSILNEDQFVNYKGNSNTNDYIPSTVTANFQEDISLPSIIQWTQNNYPSMKLVYGHFAYLDEFGVYPANRLMVLRRFATGVPHDLFIHTSKPLYTMATYYNLEKTPIDISFNENWETFDDSFLSVLEDIIGIKLESFPGIGKGINFAKTNPIAHDVLQKVASALGIQTAGDNIYGDPNVIYEAAIRKSSGEDVSSGLEAKIGITFEAKYIQREIGGIDAETAFLMILAEATHMGTSNARFLITPGSAGKINSFIESLKNGNVADLFDKIVASMSDILNQAIDKLTEVGKKVVDSVANGDISAIADGALDAIGGILKTRYQRYRWKLIGAVGAMSGMPTAPWHISIGNPKSPWFTCGNLVVKSTTIEFGGELGYNDMPTEMTVTYKLENGRSMGAEELTSLFNAGKGRIYDTIDKLQTVYAPEGNSTIRLPGNQNTNSNGINDTNNGITNQNNSEIVDTEQTNDLNTSGIASNSFTLNNIDNDNNIPSI